MLVYGIMVDAADEYCMIVESAIMVAMKRFCIAIMAEFGHQCLRQPTKTNFKKQLVINVEHGCPKIFASIDCMHYH